MFNVGDRVLVMAHRPYEATVEGTRPVWYIAGGGHEIMVKPDDSRPAREVLSTELMRLPS